jgi:hypothetical protein
MRAFLTGFAFLLSAVPAFAQPGVAIGYNGWGCDYPYVATTAPESYARGVAEIIKDQGVYNKLTAEAARQFAESQTITLDNARKWVQFYFDMKQINQEQRALLRGPKPSYSFLIRSAQEAAPRRLSPYELDPASGQINWPLLLRADFFAEYRATLERLFAFRATNPQGAMSYNTFFGIEQGTDSLMDALQSRIAKLPPQEYVAAKRFLQSLAWEASQPTFPATKVQAIGSTAPNGQGQLVANRQGAAAGRVAGRE